MAALAAAMMVVTMLVVMTMMARELKASALLPSNGICVLLGCSQLQACGTHVVGFRFRFNLLFCDFPLRRPLKHEHVSGRENFEQHNTN